MVIRLSNLISKKAKNAFMPTKIVMVWISELSANLL